MAAPKTAKATAASAEKRRKLRHNERQLIAAMARNFGPEDAEKLMDVIVKAANEGDKDAWAFLSKHCLGNGRVQLQDVISPPIIRRTR